LQFFFIVRDFHGFFQRERLSSFFRRPLKVKFFRHDGRSPLFFIGGRKLSAIYPGSLRDFITLPILAASLFPLLFS